MHEFAITESILNIAIKHAADASAIKVTDINLVLGELSGIVGDSVQFYWDIISEDTLCANSRIHFTRVKAAFRCLNCQTEFPYEDELVPCPQCGSVDLKIISGEEFYIDSIEIEK